MSAQRLSEKNVRKWANRLGIPIIRMWSHGGYNFHFITKEHFHGSVNCKSGEYVIFLDDKRHYNTCRETFPHEIYPYV